MALPWLQCGNIAACRLTSGRTGNGPPLVSFAIRPGILKTDGALTAHTAKAALPLRLVALSAGAGRSRGAFARARSRGAGTTAVRAATPGLRPACRWPFGPGFSLRRHFFTSRKEDFADRADWRHVRATLYRVGSVLTIVPTTLFRCGVHRDWAPLPNHSEETTDAAQEFVVALLGAIFELRSR